MLKENRTHITADEIDRWERHYMVGRDKEIAAFREWVNGSLPEERILNVFGTGGVGKSYLLEEFRRNCEQARIRFLLLDSSASGRTPADFCLHLMRLLHAYDPHPVEPGRELRLLQSQCLQRLEQAAASERIVLALDTFEEIGETERWLRDEFLPHVGANVLTIIAGRFPLRDHWLSSPAWRRLILCMPLADLDYEAVRLYMARLGLEQETTVGTVWLRTQGHPLTLSLYASTELKRRRPGNASMPEGEIFSYVVKTWLKEVPDPTDREMVEAAAVLRHFNQEMLSYILERTVTADQFLKLTEYSFVRRADRGWVLHDMLRDAIGHELRHRAPDYYDKLWKRCILHYYHRMKQPERRLMTDGERVNGESADWVYYIGDRFIRTLFYQSSAAYRLESLHRSNWTEAQRYIDDRRRFARDVKIQEADPDSSERYEYLIDKDKSLDSYMHASLQELYDLDPGTVKLIRDTRDAVCGLACIIPIHEGTLEYLRSKPPSSAYFTSLPEARLKELRVPSIGPAGYFIAYIDVQDYADISMRQAAGLVFFSYMLAARLVVTTSPDVPFFHAIFHSLGFEKAKHVVHCDYGDRMPAPYFVLDTRGNKRFDYLDRMVASFGLSLDTEGPEEPLYPSLSKREKSVVELLLAGATNSEIAEKLYLSEATIKKHVSNIFRKLRVKNRVQLMNRSERHDRI